MNSGPFWLANINTSSVSISYISFDQSYHVVTIGPDINFGTDEEFIKAIDVSLSTAATQANLPPESEPDSVALIIPPGWVGSDGKIISLKLKLFDQLFKELKLRPMGFIGNDDAIAEANNQTEGYLSSFVLTHFQSTTITVSLIYLGKVIARINRDFGNEFDASILESILLEINSASTLPPQIIVTGDYHEDYLNNLKSFPWVGRKDVETFLHIPDIKAYSNPELINIFLQAVSAQFHPPEPQPEAPPIVIPEKISPPALIEAESADLGFVSEEIELPKIPTINPEPSTEISVSTPEFTESPIVIKPKFKLPKINLHLPALPHLKWNLFYIPLLISPLFILIPFFFSTSVITLSLTPYVFEKSLVVTFDPSVNSVDLNRSVFPITSQSTEISTSVSVSTTGQKTVGERSTGEITIFNKADKALSFPKGQILTDSSGKKFELESAVTVSASSSDLTAGVINLGQVKTIIKAIDIGAESNLNKDTILKIKDTAESTAIGKVNSALTGGSRSQIRAVSAADKTILEGKLAQELQQKMTDFENNSSSRGSDIIPALTQIKKGRIEYNREVGEEADELSTTVVSTAVTYSLSESNKTNIITALFEKEPDFSKITNPYLKFNLSVVPQKNNLSLPRGQTTVTAEYLPKVDTKQIAHLVAGKSRDKAATLIKNQLKRVYNYQISTNFNSLSWINPLPFRAENIKVIVK